MNKKPLLPILGLSLGHLVTDMPAGALPIVLPQLQEAFSLSYSQLAAIVLLQNIMSSVIQPVFGYITDKHSLPAMLPYCCSLACAGFALIGWVSSYTLLLTTVICISLASATYHPQASKTVNFLSDDSNKGRNMGLFSLGGNAGMASGSIFMTFLLGVAGGMYNTTYFLIPGLIAFFVVLHFLGAFKAANTEHQVKQQAKESTGDRAMSYFGIFLVLLFIFFRSSIHTCISTYLPLFFIKFRGFDAVMGSSLVSGFLLGGVVGTYVGSFLNDRLGSKRIMLGSIICSIPCIGAIGFATTYTAAMVAVALAGFFIVGSFATTIVLAQSMMPNNVGMASGLTIGFSVGLGGFGVTIMGLIADAYDLPLVMQILAALPIVAALLALKIPFPKQEKG